MALVQQELYRPSGHVRQVKTEASSSPDLSPVDSSIAHFQFKFHASHGSHSHSRDFSDTTIPQFPLFRFGQSQNGSSPNSVWPNIVSNLPPRITSLSQDQLVNQPQQVSPLDSQTMSYSDDYDDLADLPSDQQNLGSYAGAGSSANDRTIRRRSSKACDQCRKSKCKCERSGANEPCKNCIMLGTPCTFLGPSRKRGPPKGYIDAIEARLHQTEALLGIMLATSDSRAQSLLSDISKDPLAKEIIARVDSSPYGVKGRKREDIALSMGGKLRSAQSSETSLTGEAKGEPAVIDITSTHPSNEWQDRVSKMLSVVAVTPASSPSDQHLSDNRHTDTSKSQSSDENYSPGGRRQRRRIGDEDYPTNSATGSTISLNQQHTHLIDSGSASTGRASLHGPTLSLSPMRGTFHHINGSTLRTGDAQPNVRRSSSVDENSLTSDSEEEFMGAVGQLSLNEDEQVRYHGKASGLYLLGNKERVDRRNEGGIWRFPKARVWPPLPLASKILSSEEEFASQLPSQQIQEHLLDLYFTYVQPIFPIIHKRSFWESYRASSYADSPHTPEPDASNNSNSPFNRRRGHIPILLLLSMFALAARYDQTMTPPPSDSSIMWSAGDEYLDRAKIILDRSYSSSRPSTCQALLLMGYREIGIGAMAQSWTYIGMAIRMAQDLGMHRSADGWERVGLGRLFSEWELNERKRIWYGCIIMDKYVSTYIGRPLMIFEWDFDTTLPSEDDPEEFDEWTLDALRGQVSTAVPGRTISCFNSSASLSGILSMIVQSIYSVRHVSSRHAESTVLEGMLDKWYHQLPEHLQYDPSSSKVVPLPNVLTLHMQYWCAVLLLHRPFIRHIVQAKQRQPEISEDPETKALAAKSYELCNAAANHITTIVSLYQEKYPISRCSVFLCYYVFTAAIMHDTNLTVYPDDPQARLSFSKCLNTLREMKIVWPSAARALELFRGAKNDETEADLSSGVPLIQITSERNKRSAEQPLDDSRFGNHNSQQSSSLNSSYGYTTPMRHSNIPNPQTTSTVTHHRQGSFSHEHGNGVFAGSDDMYLPPPVPSSHPINSNSSSLPPGSGPVMVNSGYSWQGDMNPHNHNSPLSTAVLPHMFSTGLVDEGTIHASHGRLQPHADQQQPQSRRYAPPHPPYFDYPNYSQMAPSGYNIPENVQVPQAHAQNPQNQMFIPDQYNIYNNQPYNNR